MKNLFKQKAPGPRPQQPGRVRACLNQAVARVREQFRSALRRHPRAEDVASATLPPPQTAEGDDDGVQRQVLATAAKVVTNAIARRAMQQKRGNAAKVRAILHLAVETEEFFARLAIGQLGRDPVLSLGVLHRFLDRRGSLNGLVTRRHVGQGWCLTMPLLLPPTVASTYPIPVREAVGAMAIQRMARRFMARRALWRNKAGWADDKIEPVYHVYITIPSPTGPRQQSLSAFLSIAKAAEEARARALVAADWIGVMAALMRVVRRQHHTARFTTLARGLRRSIALDVAKTHQLAKKAEVMRVRNLQRHLSAYLFEWRKSTTTTRQHREALMPIVDTMAKCQGQLTNARLLARWRLKVQHSKSARREAELVQYVRDVRLECDTKLAMAETQRCQTALLSRAFVAWMREAKNAQIARLKASLEHAKACAVTAAGALDPVSGPSYDASPYNNDVITMLGENDGTYCNDAPQPTAMPDLNEASTHNNNNNNHTRRENRRSKKGGKRQQQYDDAAVSPPDAHDPEPLPQDAHHTVTHETSDELPPTDNRYTHYEEEEVQYTYMEEAELPVPQSQDGAVGVAGEEGEGAHQGGALVVYVEAPLPPLLGNEEEVFFDREGNLRNAPQSIIDRYAQLETQMHSWLHIERSKEVCPFVRAPLYRLWERDGANLCVWMPASGLVYTPVPSVHGYMGQANSAWARRLLANVRAFQRSLPDDQDSLDNAFEVYTEGLVDVNAYTTTVTRQTGDALDALSAMCCGALAAKHKGQYHLFLATFGDTEARDAYMNNATTQLANYTQAYTELGATFSTPPERLALNYMEGMLHFPARRQALEASYNLLNTPTKRVIHAFTVLLAVCPHQTWGAYRWLMVRQVLCLLGLEALVPLQPPNVPMKRRPTDEKAPQFLDAVPPLEADDVFVTCSAGASLSGPGRLLELGLELSRLDEDVQARAHALSTLDDDLRLAELTLHDKKRKKPLTEEQRAILQKKLMSGPALRAFKDLSMQLKENREREEHRQELHSLLARQFCSWVYEVVLSHTIEQLLVQDNVVLVQPRMPLAYQVLGLQSYEVLKDWVGRGARKLQPKRPDVKVRTKELMQSYHSCSSLFIACKGAMDDPALRLAADSTHWQDVLQVCEAEYNVDWGFGFHGEDEQPEMGH